MVDVIFRDVDAATLDRLLGVLDGVAHEVQDHTKAPWTVQAADEVLRRATLAASRLVRAVIDAGGIVTVEVARRATDPIAPHHASQSLSTTWRGLHREARSDARARQYTDAIAPPHASTARYVAGDEEVPPPPWDSPLEALRERGKLSGYRMSADLVEIFDQALRRLGR